MYSDNIRTSKSCPYVGSKWNGKVVQVCHHEFLDPRIRKDVSCQAQQRHLITRRRNGTSWWVCLRKESDRYARIARVRIAHLQISVFAALKSTKLHDPIAESEISYDLMAHLEKLKIDRAPQKEILNGLESNGPIPTREPAVLFAVPDEIVPDDEHLLEDPIDVPQEDQLRTEKRRKKFDLRTERLGSNPRETRRLLREQLEPFFFLRSYTGKKFVRILHRLGSCYNLSGLDYPNYKFVGTEMPAFLEYEKMSSVFSEGCQGRSARFQRNLHILFNGC